MKWSMICFGFVKVTFGDSDPGFSLAIKEWTGTAPGFPSGVTNVYFWLLSCIRTSYCLGPAWDNLCVDNVRLNVEVKGNYAIMAIMWHCGCMHLLLTWRKRTTSLKTTTLTSRGPGDLLEEGVKTQDTFQQWWQSQSWSLQMAMFHYLFPRPPEFPGRSGGLTKVQRPSNNSFRPSCDKKKHVSSRSC